MFCVGTDDDFPGAVENGAGVDEDINDVDINDADINDADTNVENINNPNNFGEENDNATVMNERDDDDRRYPSRERRAPE